MLSFSLNLLSLYPELYITMIVSHGTLTSTQAEILRFCGNEPTTASTRLKLVPLGKKDADPKDMFTQISTLLGELGPTLGGLLSAKVDGEEFGRRPTLAITDVRTPPVSLCKDERSSLTFPSTFHTQMFIVAFVDILQGVAASLSINPSTIPTLIFGPMTISATIECVCCLLSSGTLVSMCTYCVSAGITVLSKLAATLLLFL